MPSKCKKRLCPVLITNRGGAPSVENTQGFIGPLAPNNWRTTNTTFVPAFPGPELPLFLLAEPAAKLSIGPFRCAAVLTFVAEQLNNSNFVVTVGGTVQVGSGYPGLFYYTVYVPQGKIVTISATATEDGPELLRIFHPSLVLVCSSPGKLIINAYEC